MINIKNLSKEELIRAKTQIDSQLKYIDNIQLQSKKSSKNKTIRDLKEGDTIFCLEFSEFHPPVFDYVKIYFSKENIENKNMIEFSASHDTKGIGFTRHWFAKDCLERNFFLVEGIPQMVFYTLNPKNWRKDLEFEITRLVELKNNKHFDEIGNFKNKINKLIESDLKLPL